MMDALALVAVTLFFWPPQVPAAASALLNYDHGAPLHLSQRSVEKTQGAEVFALEYDSPRGGRVTGFLVTPTRRGRFAGIVFGHWGEGNSTEFLPEAMSYARAGAISVLVDFPWGRPSPWYKKLFPPDTTAEQDRDYLAGTIVDLERAVDVLLTRDDLDPKRIAYVGHSFGAQFGAVLSVVDRRVATAVLIAPAPSAASMWLENDEPSVAELRRTAGEDAMQQEVQAISVFDAIRFVPFASPCSLMFQFGRYDRGFNQHAMTALGDAASEPKQVRWYSAGHTLNDIDALLDRAEWLQEKIGLKRAREAVVQRHSLSNRTLKRSTGADRSRN